MQHHTLVTCPVPTGLILSFQYEIVTYLYIEHKITGFTKLPDTGGYGEFFTKKAGYKRVWIWPSGVERGGSQNFAPRRALVSAAGSRASSVTGVIGLLFTMFSTSQKTVDSTSSVVT